MKIKDHVNLISKRPKKTLIIARFFQWPNQSSADVQKKEIGNRIADNDIETHLISYNYIKQSSELKFQCHSVKKSFFNFISFGLGVRKIISKKKPDFVILTQVFGYLDLISLIRAASGIPIFYLIGASFPLCTRFFGDKFNGKGPCICNFFESPLKCFFCSMRALRGASKWWQIAMMKRLFWDSLFFIPPINFLVKHYLKKISIFLVVNTYLKSELNRILAREVPSEVIPNGVNTDIFVPKQERSQKTQKVIYLPGRSDDPAKGLAVLLRASEILRRKRKDFTIMIDKLVPNLPNYVKINKWAHNHHALVERYQKADCVVIPSLCYDATPFTLLEAMSCGIPVIASNIGGPPDIIENEKDGFLVAPGDFKDLAEKLEVLLENKDLSIKMGTAARKKMVGKYTWDIIFTNCILPFLSK